MAEFQSVGKLVSILYRKGHIYLQQKLKPLDLSHGQVKIFIYLAQNGGATQREISESFQLDKSSTSFLIQNMTEKGFVRREPNPEDGRSQILFLTEKGRAKKTEVKKIFAGWTELLLTGFSEKEKEQVFSLLNRMMDNVKFFDEDRDN